MAKPRGRKPVPPAQRKDDTIRVRVNDEQRHVLQSAADAAGADLSTWLRMVGLQAAKRTASGSGET